MHLSFICGEREGEGLHLLAINEGGGFCLYGELEPQFHSKRCIPTSKIVWKALTLPRTQFSLSVCKSPSEQCITTGPVGSPYHLQPAGLATDIPITPFRDDEPIKHKQYTRKNISPNLTLLHRRTAKTLWSFDHSECNRVKKKASSTLILLRIQRLEGKHCGA